MDKKTLFQGSTFLSLNNKNYEGSWKIQDILKQGNYGLGTFHKTNGEMIIKNGIAYLADENLNLSVAKNSVKSPFYVVGNIGNEFKNSILNSEINMNDFFSKLENDLNLKNYPIIFNIETNLINATIRSVKEQQIPFTKFIEGLEKYEVRKHFEKIKGNLIGVWFPKHFSSINVPGFHLHFVDSENKIGGHVLNFSINGKYKISFEKMINLNLNLPNNETFENSDII